MPIAEIDTENADRDISSLIAVLTHTPSATVPMLCQGYVELGDGTKDLDGSGGAFQLEITVGGQTVQPNPQTVTFSTDDRGAVWTTPFPVPANAEVVMSVLSPNAGDTDVDVTAYLYQLDAPSTVVTSGAVANIAPNSYTLTTGTQSSGTVTNTEALDGTNHEHTDATGEMDLYYEFLVGSGSPGSVRFDGYLNGINDGLEVYGYDWVAAGWVQIATLAGKALSVNDTFEWPLTAAMAGTGANLGKVRVRFTDGAFTLTTATLAVDRLLLSYSQTAGGYTDGIEVDTNASNTNTVVGIDGVKGNPVSTWAAALTLSTATGIKQFHVVNGSTITLSANSDNYTMVGKGWSLVLNGQSIDGIYVHGACAVTGTGTNGVTRPTFDRCCFGAVTLPPSEIRDCGFGVASGTFTAQAAGDYLIVGGFSSVPGSGVPNLVFSGLGSATGINVRGWTGGSNWTLDSDCTISHEVFAGGGQTFTTGGADVELRGTFRSATFTLSGAGTVQVVGTTGPVTISGTATTAVNIYGVISSLTDTSVNTTVNNLAMSYAVQNELKGLQGGKVITNAAGTQVQMHDPAGNLVVTLDRTGTGPYTWTPTWA